MTKKKIQRAEPVVREVIRRMDPIGLWAIGAPEDELDREIRSIAKQIDRIHSPADAAMIMAKVFTSSFDGQVVAACDFQTCGRELFDALKEAGLCD